MTSREVDQAINLLIRGGVIAHATEGVWGLACDPWNEKAVNRILTIKKRSIDLGLIVIGAEPSMFNEELVALSPVVQQRVVARWPGHVTWILPSKRFPDWVTGNRTTVGARVPGHKQARTLTKLFGKPIISTSANVSGSEPARTEEEVRHQFGHLVDYVVPGKIGSATGPSRILNALNEDTIR